MNCIQSLADTSSSSNLEVSPSYLHSNSTSHTWAFSAIAELIDNAYDPDVNASELWIDKRDINNIRCLTFLDNGNGMNPDKLHKMLSFGYCEKVSVGNHVPIGHYGNGFKSGSMRLGKDAIVFTRQAHTMSVGLLSQTYLTNIKAETVLVPIVTWSLPNKHRSNNIDTTNNLKAITSHSIFRDEKDLLYELEAMEKLGTGTKIIVYSMTRTQDGNYELDFSSDLQDIRNPDTHIMDYSTIHRAIGQKSPKFMTSLREYCSILYLKPRMKIIIRGKKVKTRLISKSLSQTETDVYKPTWSQKPIPIKFGFSRSKNPEDYGIMFYHRNRLIRAYEKVGYQNQPNDLGVGVVGVVQADFLTPTHNKQDFSRDEKYNAFKTTVGAKLNDYWNEKRGEGTPSTAAKVIPEDDWTWAQCDNCLKWRRLPLGFRSEDLPDKWFCHMNPVAQFNRCDIDEEPEDEDEALQAPTYKKTYKKRENERKLQIKLQEKQKSQAREMALIAKENFLRRKEMDLNKRNSVVSSSSPSKSSTAQNDQELHKKAKEQERLIKKLQRQQKEQDRRNKEVLNTLKNKELPGLEKQIANIIQGTSSSAVSSTSSNNKKKGEIHVKTEDGDYITIVNNEVEEAQSPDTSNIVDLTVDSDNEDIPPSPKRRKKSGDKSPSSPVDVKPDVTKINKKIQEAKSSTHKEQSTQTVKTEHDRDLEKSLNRSRRRLSDLQHNVYKLLKMIVPDEDIGTVDNIDEIVREMIKHNETS